MRVAVQVWVRLAPEVGHDVLQIHRQQEDARHRHGHAEPPAASRDREPYPETDDGDRGVFAARERRHQCRAAPPVPLGVERERSGDQQRNREGLWVDVADVDPVERRIDQQEQREAAGDRGRPEAPPRVAEHREAAGGEDEGLRQEQGGGTGYQPAQRRQRIEHRREMIAPRVHRRERDIRPVARRDAPDDLDVVAEVEGVGLQGEMARDDDESHRHGVDECPDDGRAQRRDRGDGQRRDQRSQRDERREDHHQILGARERDTADGPAARREHGDQNRGHRAGHQLEWPGQSRQGRRVYLARRLSKRRERRRPRLFKTNQKSTARIRRP